MNQTTPPNTPDSDFEDGRSPSFAQDRANPYYTSAHQQAEPAPNLDAASPTLTMAESQRLNRRALLFLGGIVLLLFLLGYFMLSGKNRDEEADKRPKPDADQALVVPNLPTAGEEETVPPVDLAQTQPELPPLPEQIPNEDGAAGGTESQGPTLLERRMKAAAAGGGSAGSAGGNLEHSNAAQNAMLGLPPGGTPAATVAEAETSAQFMSNPNALLVRGTYLRCVLETRIVTDVPGFTSCILTEPVYSVNGRQLLLPKGSKLLGSYQDQADGIARVSVVWDRIITPNGIDVAMTSPGVDGLGGAGHPGDYNAHWGSKIMSALLISLISDAFQWAAAEHGPRSATLYTGPVGTTVVDQPFQSATARSMERLANQALQRSAQRKGTVTINHGTVVNVYVAQDVDFSAVMALR